MKQSFLKKNWMIFFGFVQLFIGSIYFIAGRYDHEHAIISVLSGGQVLLGLWAIIYGFYIKKKQLLIEENNK